MSLICKAFSYILPLLLKQKTASSSALIVICFAETVNESASGKEITNFTDTL
jgi:hypothetical protein